MQYQTLYEAWKKEQESRELRPLSKGFYAEASALMRAQRDEIQMLDERSIRAKLLSGQQTRSNKLLTNLVEMRFQKICHCVFDGKPPNKDILASEEEGMVDSLASVKEEFDTILKAVLSGRPPRVVRGRLGERPKRLMVRFLQDIPPIVGANARIYGPFKAEDIATLPAENAESLIKRGVALRVEVG